MTDIPKLSMDARPQEIDFDFQTAKAMTKRLFDIVGSAVLIVAFMPLMIIVGSLVAARVGPRVIFAHEREGRDGKKFLCLKFRTMHLDADRRLSEILATDPAAAAEWQEKRKLKNDPRILPGVGNFLRKSSLDELPQLFNVLVGEMSLVGPRPVVEQEIAEHYGDKAALYYSMRPGMTGPWQCGDRSNGSYVERVRQDAEYVTSWTIVGDIAIIAKTAVKVLNVRSSGAY